jgi:selenophosphate synthetase-related protein
LTQDPINNGPSDGDLTVTKRPDPFDRFQKALRALAGLITALTTAAWTGHTIGWW